ncbi:MAG: hypothetical protein H7Z37_18185 [Pyrinomonadaceae bacterium]|nr:hypothetical protein [Pyrinomonadaceae bacterium]
MNASNLERYERKAISPWFIVLLHIGAVLIANVLRDVFGIHIFAGLTFGYWLGFVIGYWILPKPPTSFLIWFFRMTALFLSIAICLWLIPVWLSNYIWKPFAYALPVFALIFCSYWVKPIYPVGETATLKKMALIGLVFGFAYGTAMYFIE